MNKYYKNFNLLLNKTYKFRPKGCLKKNRNIAYSRHFEVWE